MMLMIFSYEHFQTVCIIQAQKQDMSKFILQYSDNYLLRNLVQSVHMNTADVFFVIVYWSCCSSMKSQWYRVWTATMVLVWVHLVVNMPVCWDLEDTVDLISQLFQSLHNLSQIPHSLTGLHHHHHHYQCHWEVTMTLLHYVNQEEMTVQIGKLYPGECGTYIMTERYPVGTMMSL